MHLPIEIYGMNAVNLKRLFIEVMAGLFVLLYLYTAIMKLRGIPLFIGSMSHVPLIQAHANLLSGLIPAMELAVSVFLIIPGTRFYGLVMATGLMAAFTFYVSYILISPEKLPCSCGGIIEQLGWVGHLFLNGSLLLGGALSIVFNNQIIAINRRSRTTAI